MITETLFRENSYLKTCHATVVAVTEQGIIFDQTIFYPLGGGQPGDTGVITRDNGEKIKVIDTRKSKEHPQAIVHWVAPDSSHLSEGEKVELTIDWDNRYRYMRMHTCLHLFCSLIPYPVTGGNISLQKGRLDFDMPDSPDKAELTARLNQLIEKNIDVATRWISDEEMTANMELVKTMSVKPPIGFGKVRLVDVPGVDLQPCGGTHIKNTQEIGKVDVIKVENKGKQNRRIILQLMD